MKTINYFSLLLLTCIGLLNTGCKKFITVDTPPTQLLEPAVFSNSATATSAVLGLYSKMNNSPSTFFCGGLSEYGGLSADEIINTTSSSTFDPFSQNALLSTTSTVGALWSAAYGLVYQCNDIVEGLNKSTSLTDSLKKELSAEVKLVRAFIYFNMANGWGNVPLVLSTDYRINDTLSRTPVTLTYNQVEQDLQDAIASLPATVNPGRPNKWAALALLSRVYLYEQKWALAETQASAVINSGLFSIVTNLNNVFLVGSNEIIWELMPVGTASINAPEGNIFIPSSATTRPSFAMTPYLLNAFEVNDQRKINWTKTVTVNSINYTYPFKYKLRTNSTVAEANIVMRLAEQYLVRAEARAQQNNISGAQSDINMIRSRAVLGPTTANTTALLLTAIEHERQTELFTEWGHRWFDLKRTNRADAVLGTEKASYWQSTDALWPIPFNEISLNPHLIQNPGY